MTLTSALVVTDSPCYTKTNTAGHESVVSSDDGQIEILVSAIARNVTTEGSLAAGDTITLVYSDNVNVILPIYVANLTWTPTTSGTAVFAGALEVLKATSSTDTTEVLLTAVTAVNFADSAESITFNVPANVRIVDAAGGNFVLPWASDSAAHFDSGDF